MSFINKNISNLINMNEFLSSQSIEDKLQQSQSKSIQQGKNQYLINLKSECLFKQNALKTAQTLILEYQRQNEQLKMDKLIMTQKIEEYELKQKQFQKQQQFNRNNEKQLLKMTQKLTEIYQKYSSLQKKYYHAQKQLQKHKKKQMQRKRHVRQRSQIEEQTQKQYKQFLKTSYSKQKDQKQSKYANNYQSQTTQWKSRSSQKNYKQLSKVNNDAIKYQNINRINKRCEQPNSSVNQDTKRQLKHLQWKIKQKDQEIMLMLRRNKQIQQKYETLLKITESRQRLNVMERDQTYKYKKLTLNQLTNDSIDNYSTWKNQYLSSFYS